MAIKQIIPRREGDFNAWTNHFADTLTQHADEYFLTDIEVKDLKRLHAAWDKDYAAAISASDIARAATETKNETRAALEQLERNIAKRIMADTRVSNSLQKEAGLPVHKKTRTPVPVPTTSPKGQIVATNRLEHSILVTDSQTPTKRSKPPGVIGCEVMLLISETYSVNPADYSLVGLWTRFPDVVTFTAKDAGKTAHYLFRWINTKGEKGPWSPTTSATIPAV